MTIIYVTHYVDEVLDIFKSALFLKQGMVAACGAVETVFTSQQFTRLIDYPVEIYRDDRGAIKAVAQVSSRIYEILQEVQPS